MNKHVKTVITYVACFLAFSAGKVFFDDYQKSKSISQRDSAIFDMVLEMNKSTPKMVDELTRLDGFSYMKGVAINAEFTIPSMQRKDINRTEFLDGIRKAAASQICSSPSAKLVMDHGISYGYLYRDSEGASVADFKISKADCT